MTKTEQLIMDMIKGIKNVSFEKKSYTFDFTSYQTDKTVIYYRNIIEPNKFLIAQQLSLAKPFQGLLISNSIKLQRNQIYFHTG